MCRIDENGYYTYSLEYVRELQESQEDSMTAEYAISLLLISLIRCKVFRLHNNYADELANRITKYGKEYAAKQKRILDEHRRASIVKVPRRRNKSGSDTSKERHRHDSSQRTQWVRARRAR